MKEINVRVKEIREAKGMSQQELAIRSGFKSRSTISKIESGTREVTLDAGIKIAKALGVNPDYLIFGDVDVKDEINRLFDLLSIEQQESVLQFLRTMLGDKAKD